MDARYHVSADPITGLVLIRLAGFFTDADVGALHELCRQEYARLGSRMRQHVTLIDIIGADIQSGEALATFARILADPQLMGRRLAFVVPRSLAHAQARRLGAVRGAAFFDSIDAAEEWLFGRLTPQAA